MSNRRRLNPPATDALRRLDGARIPGGCQHCDAYQVVVSPAHGIPNLTMLNTYHDDWCPFLARYEGRQP